MKENEAWRRNKFTILHIKIWNIRFILFPQSSLDSQWDHQGWIVDNIQKGYLLNKEKDYFEI